MRRFAWTALRLAVFLAAVGCGPPSREGYPNRAGNAGGTSSDLPAPTGVHAEALSTTSIRVSWTDASEGSATFEVSRATAPEGPWSLAAQLEAGETNALVDGLDPETTYFFRVVALIDARQSAPSEVVSARTLSPADVSPTAPGNVQATSVSDTEIKITWEASTDRSGTGIAGYRLHLNGLLLREVVGTEWLDGHLANGVTYCYAVEAFDGADNTSPLSAEACAVPGQSSPGAPTVSLTAPASGASFSAPASVSLSASATDSDGTVVRVEFYEGTTLLQADTSAPFAATWSNVPEGSYILTARAIDDQGMSATSEPVTISVGAGGSGPRVVSFTLINADTDQPIAGFNPIAAGATIDLDQLPTRNLNIRANTNPSPTGSVRFGYDGNNNFKTESNLPYALFGDQGGNFTAGTLSVGMHTLTGTAYTASGAGGTAGTPLTLTFNVVDP